MSQYYNNRFKKPQPTTMKRPFVEVKGGTVNSCENTPVPINANTAGAVAKLPVVLAELNVQFNVSSTIKLPELALDIKRIRKTLKITQCLLLQDTNVLFIKGFVRKNIEYSTPGWCSNPYGLCGEIRHCTVDVPFDCTTPITFNGNDPLPIIGTSNDEFVYLRSQEINRPEYAEKDRLLSSDLSEINLISTEYYNELPYCDLISSRIVEFDEHLDRTTANYRLPVGEKLFREIEEKMVIFLTIKLLQNQQVAIAPIVGPCAK
ncbi:hypothetical protein F8153_05225 [Alkaliphilus serpentinus]|uniref:SipL SPOCS domain-containing protein n=2 Tax=Alkaliphilus serpentinus TaxID=1482731 RepID=A0A833M813_9FIRM|nr:hypothetical protein F8153_05225 [Alkaliphilus serpentinus]